MKDFRKLGGRELNLITIFKDNYAGGPQEKAD